MLTEKNKSKLMGNKINPAIIPHNKQLKKIINDMKQLENEYEHVINELMDNHQKLMERKIKK